jgi:hypothetical protein
MTCVTYKAGNRHTTRHHRRKSSALKSARQNRYTNPLHTASADRSHVLITDAIMHGMPPHIAQLVAGHKDINTTMGYRGRLPRGSDHRPPGVHRPPPGPAAQC